MKQVEKKIATGICLPKQVIDKIDLPRWLIKMTGDPYRKARFGPFLDLKSRKLEMKTFSFDQFAFPACESCNKKFSDLEISVSQTLKGILKEDAVSSTEFSFFLSWLDKIRVGCWLIAYSTQHNPFSITKGFHIDWRVDASDRMVLIYKSNSTSSRLLVNGANTPIFQLQPSCFALIVNNFIFLNVSLDFLVSERLGLPYPSEVSFTDTAAISYSMVEGREKIQSPIVRLRYDQHCTQLFQPIFRPEIRKLFPLYETEYVRKMSNDQMRGIGKIFLSTTKFVEEYPNQKTKSWVPEVTWNDRNLLMAVAKQCLEFQLQLAQYGASDRKISCKYVTKKAQKRLIKNRTRIATWANRELLGTRNLGMAVTTLGIQ